MARKKQSARPFRPSDRQRLLQFTPPVGSCDAIFQLLNRLDPNNLPEQLSPADLNGSEQEARELFDAMRFLCFVTPDGHPTGSMMMLATKGAARQRWRRDLWYIVHRAYEELLWDVNPETATPEEIEPRFATHCERNGTDPRRACEFYVQLRKEAGMDPAEFAAEKRVAQPISSPTPLSTEASVEAMLELRLPLRRGRGAMIQIPRTFDQDDLRVLHAAIQMLELAVVVGNEKQA